MLALDKDSSLLAVPLAKQPSVDLQDSLSTLMAIHIACIYLIKEFTSQQMKCDNATNIMAYLTLNH